MRSYPITYVAEAREQISRLHPQVKRAIRGAIELLSEDSWLGKPLQRELAGYFSLRHKDYRIVYQVVGGKGGVEIQTVGRRREIYHSLPPVPLPSRPLSFLDKGARVK